MDELLVENDDGVATLTFNRPDAMNAINAPLTAAFREAVFEVATDQDVRCVVITGAGKAFCAGGDMNVIRTRDAKQAASPRGVPIERRIEHLRQGMMVSKTLHDMGKPTISMINGACAGFGMSVAGACDFRFAGTSALLTTAFVKMGVSGDSGGSWYWTQILGTAKARRLYLLSERFRGQEAYEFGLVNEVWPDEELKTRTMAIARQLADSAPAALRYIKEALNAAEESSFQRTLDYEAITMTLSGVAKAAATRALADAAKAEGDVK